MNTAFGRPWAPTEDAVIAAHYKKRGGAAHVQAVLRDRTTSAIRQRAAKLGIEIRHTWTTRDDDTLRDLWGEKTVRGIAKLIGVSPMAAFWRAMRIGLPAGCPKGCETMKAAARRVGYDQKALRRILEQSKVAIRPTMSCPKGYKRRPHHFVDRSEVDEAVAAWVKAEPIHTAARRLGTDGRTLARRLEGVDGLPPKPQEKRHWRIPTAIIDRAVGRGRAAA